jgi:uncharacterized protein (TIGR02217 family)
MAFHDVLFPKEISQGAKGGATWSTTKVTASSGWTQKNQDWAYPKHIYDVSHILNTEARRKQLKDFALLRRGQANSFRFRDPFEYDVGKAWVNGVRDFVSIHNFDVGTGAKTVFQLAIKYQDAAATLTRPITKPVVGAVRIYVNNALKIEGTDYTLDYTTGKVTFTAAPALGLAVGWAGTFDLHVSFESDEALMQLDAPNTGKWDAIRVVEERDEL